MADSRFAVPISIFVVAAVLPNLLHLSFRVVLLLRGLLSGSIVAMVRCHLCCFVRRYRCRRLLVRCCFCRRSGLFVVALVVEGVLVRPFYKGDYMALGLYSHKKVNIREYK